MGVSVTESGAQIRRRLLSIFGGSIGNLIEWYDFYVYSFFSLYFAKAFFPNAEPTVQLLNAALIFGLGFFIRPLGGWLLGTYADRRGRRAALTLSVLLMCLGSLIVAICPTYAQAGVLAPIILVFARLLQGLSLGGEYGTSATYLSEVATKARRGFYSSFQYVTLIAGQLLATLTLLFLQQIITPAGLEAWGWRIPFVLGAVCALVGFWLRRNLVETDDFRAADASGRNRQPWTELLRHKKEVALVFGLTMGGTLAFYTYTTYMPKYLVNTVGLTRDTATLISTCSLFLYMCLQPVFGMISDRIGRRPVLIFFGVMGTLCTVPILSALQSTHSAVTAFLLIMAALVIVSGYTAINAVVKAELFPAGIRALGVGLPYAVAVSIFGGSAEYVALFLKSRGVESAFYWYVSGCVLVSLLVYVFMRDTRNRSAIG
jgi:MHS family alpha-ketoglutarate permease-like MFS transporter